jgi:hypothetical protein
MSARTSVQAFTQIFFDLVERNTFLRHRIARTHRDLLILE